MRALGMQGQRWMVAGGLAILTGTVVGLPAEAAGGGYDSVSNVAIATACGTHDDMSSLLSFTVETDAATPSTGQIQRFDVDLGMADVDGYVDPSSHWLGAVYPLDTDPYWTLDPGEASAAFVAGDYSIDLSYWVFPLSTVNGDTIDISFVHGDDTRAGGDFAAVSCYTGTDGATVNDFEITARVGVPRSYRLLEHVMYGGFGADSASQSWIQSQGLAWNADGRDDDSLDDLVLDGATASALGASLSDDAVLTLNATAPGDYTLEWGIVTSPDGTWNWSGGYGDIWGPATLTVHVIDAPVLPSDASLSDATRGTVSAPSTVTPGASTVVDLGDDAAGTYVDVWMRSDPTYLGLMQVGPDGKITVAVPSTLASGDHRVIVTDEIGGLVGWTGTRVAGAQALAATGPDSGSRSAMMLASIAAALVLVGSGVLVATSRRGAAMGL